MSGSSSVEAWLASHRAGVEADGPFYILIRAVIYDLDGIGADLTAQNAPRR